MSSGLRVLILAGCLLLDGGLAFSHTLKVVSFNILAPPWASTTHYPDQCVHELPRELRRDRIIGVINGLKSGTDVFCLQEVTPIEYDKIAMALKEFTGFHVNHDPGYWSHYITDHPPWEPNGNAVFVREDLFEEVAFSDIPLSDGGNHSVYFEGIHSASGRQIRLFCVHLDSDEASNRKTEIGAVIDFLGASGDSVDLIAGDMNSIPFNGNYAVKLQENGYFDLHEVLGSEGKTYPLVNEPTHHEHSGRIDHILLRNANPLSAEILHYDLFIDFPVVPEHSYEAARIRAALQITGSDHLPIWGIIEF